MWLVLITIMDFPLLKYANAQLVSFNPGSRWPYGLPYEQLSARNFINSYYYYQQPYSLISEPINGFNSNHYTIPMQSVVPVATFGAATTSFQKAPSQATWTANISPLIANQKTYVGHIMEIKKSDNDTNNDAITLANVGNTSIDVNSRLPIFLQGTSDDIHKKFYEIVSNPNENYEQKQIKLDVLVSNLGRKNQELYEQYRELKELEEREKRKRVHAIVATMSEKAQAIFAKLSAVLMNPQMKDIDRLNKLNDFYKEADDDVKKEFKDRAPELNRIM